MKENVYITTKNIMKKYNIHANKSLGQNFLINEDIINEIIDKSEIKKTDLIIEIGPGLGVLTEKLIEQAGKVVCIEIDSRMINILNERFINKNFTLINDDVLKVNLNTIINEELEKNNLKSCKIVANLPYYITTPIIMKLLEEKLNIESIIVMVQKEVAQRLTAIPGDRLAGAITYTVNYFCEAMQIVEVGKNNFLPEPEVDSSVIKLNIRKNKIIDIKNEKQFFKIIKIAFMQRRKTLLNALVNGGLFEKEELVDVLTKLKIDLTIRGEKLTLEDYSKIEKYIR